MKKRVMLPLIAAGVGLAVWLRSRKAEDLDHEPWETGPEETLGKLGGEVDPELLAILACPLDKAAVAREGDYIVCSECNRHYPIRDGIPVMLIEEAVIPEEGASSQGAGGSS